MKSLTDNFLFRLLMITVSATIVVSMLRNIHITVAVEGREGNLHITHHAGFGKAFDVKVTNY